MQKKNYQKMLDEILADKENYGKKLLLHSCCAPCSSYVLEYLRGFFRITVFYYNPNITEEPEYHKRVEEQKRLIREWNRREDVGKEAFSIEIIEGDYERELYFERIKGLEACREGGERCFACFLLRLEKTAALGKEEGADYFTTTLTISPLKNAQKINEIGEELAEIYKVPHLTSDFKKKNGYKRSIELSHEHALYRQNYCGCVFSKKEAMDRERLVTENRVNSNNG